MADDLSEFIRAQRDKLERERDEHVRKTHTVKGDKQKRSVDSLDDREERENVPTAKVQNKTSINATGLPLGDHEKKQKELREERAREYHAFLQQQNEGRRPVGDQNEQKGATLPLEDRAAERDRLRAERQSEYRAFLEHSKKDGKKDNQPLLPRQGSRGGKRDHDLRHGEEKLSVGNGRERLAAIRHTEERDHKRQERYKDDRGGKSRDYDDMLARKRQEERRYRLQLYDDDDRDYERKSQDRREWNERQTVRNRWREDEELDQWARDYSHRGRRPVSHEGNRSPHLYSPHGHHSSDNLKSRTHSAPSSRMESKVCSIAALGDDKSLETKRQKQKQYAEELRQQMLNKHSGGEAIERHEKTHGDMKKPVPILKQASRWSDDEFDLREEREGRQRRQRRSQERDEYDLNDSYGDGGRRSNRDWLDDWRETGGHYNDNMSNRGGRVRFQDDNDYGWNASWKTRDADEYYGISLQNDSSQPKTRRHHTSDRPQVERSVDTDSGRSPVGMTSTRGDRVVVDKEGYRRELEQQMREKQLAKEKRKKQGEEYDRHKEEEIAIYDPWGKAGAGAPMKDRQGRVVTDLRKMRASNEQRLVSHGQITNSPPALDRTQPSVNPMIQSEMELQRGVYSLPDTQGTGITGLLSSMNPGQQWQGNESEAGGETKAMTAQEEYREYLRKQVEEKAAQRAKEAEDRRLEEEKEAARIEQERIKLKQEYEEEMAKQRKKEEEAKRQNQELMAQQEARRKQMDMKQTRINDHTHVVERKPEIERVVQVEHRTASPPIPTLANRVDVSRSPPVPALLNQSSTKQQQHHVIIQMPTPQQEVPRPTQEKNRDGETVLDSLTVMRTKLQNEQQRLRDHRQREKETHSSLQEEVKRGRQVQQQIEMRKLPKDPNEIFDIARSKGKKAALVHYSVRKPYPLSDPPMSEEIPNQQGVIGQEQSSVKAAADFNRLKYETSSNSRQAFWEKFPQPPTSSGHLDLQQQALIRQQRDELDTLRLKSDPLYSKLTANRPISEKSVRSLQADSTFVTVDDNQSALHQQASTNQEDRQTSARVRRRIRNEQTQETADVQSLSSLTSFDVDRVAARNAERLRRLEQIAGGKSDINQPQDVLDRFMKEHGLDGRIRPPSRVSERSLEAETWLRPATGNTTAM